MSKKVVGRSLKPPKIRFFKAYFVITNPHTNKFTVTDQLTLATRNDQYSEMIHLDAGRVYFMKALLKEGGGGDHIQVGVKLPTGEDEETISIKNLFVSNPCK